MCQQEDVCMLAWGNINLFDFRGRLIQGKTRLDLWPAPLSFDSMPIFNPLGITGIVSSTSYTTRDFKK